MQKLSSQSLPWPADWPALFGAVRPLILEIGFGRGAFLLHLARENPDANIVGLEISNRCLNVTERAVEREKLSNIRLIHSTAQTALAHLFTSASLAQVYINFPDPWFKERHDHRRLVQRDTLDLIIDRLQPEGILALATDIHPYAEVMDELLSASPGLENTLSSPWADTLPGRVITKYEAKARAEGRPCHYFIYRRTHFPAPPVNIPKEVEMPHVVFSSPLRRDEMLAAFTPTEHQAGDAWISFMYAYQGEKALLVEVFVKEPTITQHLALNVLERAPNEYTVLLSPLGHPRPTSGVHDAVILLAQWLVGLHADARIIKQKVHAVDGD